MEGGPPLAYKIDAGAMGAMATGTVILHDKRLWVDVGDLIRWDVSLLAPFPSGSGELACQVAVAVQPGVVASLRW